MLTFSLLKFGFVLSFSTVHSPASVVICSRLFTVLCIVYLLFLLTGHMVLKDRLFKHIKLIEMSSSDVFEIFLVAACQSHIQTVKCYRLHLKPRT